MNEGMLVAVVGLALMFLFLALGMPIGFAMIIVGAGGLVYMRDLPVALSTLATTTFYTTYSFTFMVLPLFILMGLCAESIGIVEHLFKALRVTMRGIPGGLVSVSLFTAAGFAACTGSSTGSAALMGSTILPELRAKGYNLRLSAGAIAASGTLAAMIPPSGLIVIYSIISDTSIGQTLMAAVIPGIITALVYTLYVVVRVTIDPTLVPRETEKTSLKARLVNIPKMWEILPFVIIIIGGMYAGIVTATEAAAVAALVALLMALAKKKGRKNLAKSLLQSAEISIMIAIIIVGAMVFMRFIAYTEVIPGMVAGLCSLSSNRYVILALIILMYLVLGCFLDALAMVILTMPFVLPIMVSLDFSLVWFGIILVEMVEIGLVTPPFGLNVFVLRGVQPDISLGDIFRGAIGYTIPNFCVVILLIIFPQIALFLPSTMG